MNYSTAKPLESGPGVDLWYFCHFREHLAQGYVFRLSNLILLINKDDMRLQRANFLFIVLPIIHDNHDIALGSMTGSSDSMDRALRGWGLG